MRRFAFTIVAATAFVIGVPTMGTNVSAAPIAAPGTPDNMNMVERVQFIWLGHNYCWYDDAWNGAGWYWCGYAFNRGNGWGGGFGWHNWHGGHAGGHGGGHGGGMGMMSDIRTKHDIVLLGHLDNGLGFYRFSYNGSAKAYVGVVAQEVQAIRPDAVARGKDGYLRVYYDRLGFPMQTWKEWVDSGEKIPVTTTSIRQ